MDKNEQNNQKEKTMYIMDEHFNSIEIREYITVTELKALFKNKYNMIKTNKQIISMFPFNIYFHAKYDKKKNENVIINNKNTYQCKPFYEENDNCRVTGKDKYFNEFLNYLHIKKELDLYCNKNHILTLEVNNDNKIKITYFNLILNVPSIFLEELNLFLSDDDKLSVNNQSFFYTDFLFDSPIKPKGLEHSLGISFGIDFINLDFTYGLNYINIEDLLIESNAVNDLIRTLDEKNNLLKQENKGGRPSAKYKDDIIALGNKIFKIYPDHNKERISEAIYELIHNLNYFNDPNFTISHITIRKYLTDSKIGKSRGKQNKINNLRQFL